MLALAGAAFYAGGTNRLEMYKYFLFCKENMVYRHKYSEDIYQLVMSQQGLNEHIVAIKASATDGSRSSVWSSSLSGAISASRRRIRPVSSSMWPQPCRSCRAISRRSSTKSLLTWPLPNSASRVSSARKAIRAISLSAGRLRRYSRWVCRWLIMPVGR